MKRTQIFLTEYERQELKKIKEERGLSISELIRRIIDDYLATRNKRDDG